MKKRRLGFQTYRRIIGDAKQYWYLFVIGAIGTVVLSSVDAGLTWLLKPILDKGFIDRNQSFIAWLPLIILGIFSFVVSVVLYRIIALVGWHEVS